MYGLLQLFIGVTFTRQLSCPQAVLTRRDQLEAKKKAKEPDQDDGNEDGTQEAQKKPAARSKANAKEKAQPKAKAKVQPKPQASPKKRSRGAKRLEPKEEEKPAVDPKPKKAKMEEAPKTPPTDCQLFPDEDPEEEEKEVDPPVEEEPVVLKRPAAKEGEESMQGGGEGARAWRTWARGAWGRSWRKAKEESPSQSEGKGGRRSNPQRRREKQSQRLGRKESPQRLMLKSLGRMGRLMNCWMTPWRASCWQWSRKSSLAPLIRSRRSCLKRRRICILSTSMPGSTSTGLSVRVRCQCLWPAIRGALWCLCLCFQERFVEQSDGSCICLLVHGSHLSAIMTNFYITSHLSQNLTSLHQFFWNRTNQCLKRHISFPHGMVEPSFTVWMVCRPRFSTSTVRIRTSWKASALVVPSSKWRSPRSLWMPSVLSGRVRESESWVGISVRWSFCIGPLGTLASALIPATPWRWSCIFK